MTVACPDCGKLSLDREYCEHCHADLRSLRDRRPPDECPVGEPTIILSDADRDLLRQPDAAVYVAAQGVFRRVHWLSLDADPDWMQAWNRRQQRTALPVPRTLAQKGGTWIWAETSGIGLVPWLRRPGQSPFETLRDLVEFADELSGVLEHLHRHGLFWLNFEPTELERGPGGELRITNLDTRVFPQNEAPHSLAVHAAFAAPEVVYLKVADLGPRTDVFHLSAFCYYWLAGKLPNGLPGEGLEAFDFHLPPLRVYAPGVPEGVAAVLARGLSMESHHRFESPSALVAELRLAMNRAEARRTVTNPIRWDIGSHTRTGRTKTALRRGNEDNVLVRTYDDPPCALLAVADGITTCDIGNGALASLIANIVVENHLGNADAADFPAKIKEVCYKSSTTLLEWALEKGYRDQLQRGRDLMGTTLTAAWLQGNTLQIANLGDSRAYLIDGLRIEQLTVDGDLASDLLAQGMAPEQLRELGSMGKALRQCIGGCDLLPNGEIAILSDSCLPSISDWPVVPGDIIVLCSDGLVEEGAFLEPEILVEIVRNHPRASAQELADLFAEAADALQRLPSSIEPDGFGDNISCIVIKCLSAPSVNAN